MNYYPRHIGDYVKDTSHLTLLEHGVYVRLLDIYYDREGALPTQCEGNANAMLHRLVGARNDDERRAVDDILAEFFVLKDGAWHNKRANEEIEKNAERARKASESASKRWGKCEGNANAMPTQCEGNAPQKPKAKSQSNTPKGDGKPSRDTAKPGNDPDQPYEIARTTLSRVATQMGWPEPTIHDVKRNLKANGLQGVVNEFGPDKACQMFILALGSWGSASWEGVFNHRYALSDELGGKRPQKNGKPPPAGAHLPELGREA